MRRTYTLIALLVAAGFALPGRAQINWTKIAARPGLVNENAHIPESAPVYYTDPASLANTFQAATGQSGPATLDIPMPDGSIRSFRVSESSLLPPQLAARYPSIKALTAVCVDDPTVTAKIDHTVFGFHAMVFDGSTISFVDPASSMNDGYYTAHYKSDEVMTPGITHGCQSISAEARQAAKLTAPVERQLNGYTSRKYRLAISCTWQYAQKATGTTSPSKEQVLSKMTTTMNRVNGVYERELAVTMQFVPNEDALIFTSSSGSDPVSLYNESAGGLMSANQALCDAVIGNANYDIGHAFSTGAGGLSQVGVVCKATLKAQSVTGSENPTGDGFDIDYVAHEIGHEFGSDHTFNNNQSYACGSNAVQASAFEPGSGSTIMAYAGICSPDNIQPHSDDYFHASSLRQMFIYINGPGDACAAHTSTGNLPPGLPSFAATYTIPARTPFTLTAPDAYDSTGGADITYCWEQWNTGDFGRTQAATSVYGPLFRSFPPAQSSKRMFPSEKLMLKGITRNDTVDKASGEKLPEETRYLTFRLTARSQKGQFGCFTMADDTMHIDVVASGTTGFTVTSQNATGLDYQGYSNQQVTWNVAGSNNAPISAAEVEIYLSPDGGKTWPHLLGTFPNTGSANVTIPNPDSNITAARFMVKAVGNIFFNVNTKDFRVTRNFDLSLKVSPVPASHVLHIASDNTNPIKMAAFNAIGKQQWEGEITGNTDLQIHTWARGVYILKFVDSGNRTSIRRIVVQ
jgi:hypothetical protein